MRSTAGDRVRLGFHLFFFAFSCAVPELIFVVSGDRNVSHQWVVMYAEACWVRL